jgi:hypothetical protein
MTFIEEDTVGELHQEKLVWQEEHQTMLQDEYEWRASDDSDEDKKPAAKVKLSVETDDLMEGKGIVFISVFL